ncbi:MAG: type IV secretion system protein [Alphaproteobacteria bacterium]|nr:type IV secretion system protein [Alphaproteobacteria bacterium]
MSDKGKNTSHDYAIAWGIFVFIAFVLSMLVWFYFDSEIRNLVRWLRYGEMWLASWFIWSDDYTVQYDGQPVSWARGFRDTPRWNAEELNYGHMAYFTALALQPYKIFLTILFSLAALWCLFRGPQTQYRRTLGLEGLIARQASNFAVISPFVKFNPSKQPPRAPGTPVPAELPLFAEALGPEEWVAYNSIPVPDGKVDTLAAARVFRQQLGAPWRGIKHLKPYQQILLAAFCLKASRKRVDSDEILGRLARCWSFEHGLNLRQDRKLLREARAILADKKLSANTLEEMNKHAFVTTAFLGALKFGRDEGGVLAPAQFVWLRGHDRTLWYPLNNLGRHSFHMEALGAMSHFRAERMTQRPILAPQMDDALKSAVEYFTSKRVRPIPELDYSGSKKRGIKKAV